MEDCAWDLWQGSMVGCMEWVGALGDTLGLMNAGNYGKCGLVSSS